MGRLFFSHVFLNIHLSSRVRRFDWSAIYGRGIPENMMIFFLHFPGMDLRTIYRSTPRSNIRTSRISRPRFSASSQSTLALSSVRGPGFFASFIMNKSLPRPIIQSVISSSHRLRNLAMGLHKNHTCNRSKRILMVSKYQLR